MQTPPLIKTIILITLLPALTLIAGTVCQGSKGTGPVMEALNPGRHECDHANHQVKVNIDWPAFMEKHKLIWDIFPARWETGPFIGNGITGSIICATSDSAKVQWYLCRSDVGRLDFPGSARNGPMRIQIGSMNLETQGKILLNESRADLDIWNAEAAGIIKTTLGEIKWRAFAPLDEPAIIIELFDIKGEEKQCRWLPEFLCEGNDEIIEGINTHRVEDKQHHPRSEVKSGGHAIAWIEDASERTRRLYIAISSSPATKQIWDRSPGSSLSSLQGALSSLRNVRGKDIGVLTAEHRNWWHTFYQKSFMSIPRLELESYYWIQLYKMASSSREGYPMIDNHGVWSIIPMYGFATWDYNVQSTYRLHLKSNHLELGEPLVRFMDGSFNEETMWNEKYMELRAGMKQQTFLRYRFFDTETWEHAGNAKSPALPADGPAKFLWGCHNYWMQYRYSMDGSLLKNLLIKLEGGINAMAAALEKESDGKLHIPVGGSWEAWAGKDPTGQIAILDWALSTAQWIGNELDYDKVKIARWAYLRDNLTDYPAGIYPDGKTGYLLGKDQVPLPHRHWTHLMMIFPLHTLTWDQVDKRELIRNSVDYWSYISTGLDGIKIPACFASVASLCLYANIGETDKINDLFDIILYKVGERGQPVVWPNTMYREFGPVIETPLLFASGLQDLLLQSYNHIIKVFPAVPDDWNDAVFHDFRAEGGFLISAKYKDGNTEFIHINSLEGEDFILETGMGLSEHSYPGESCEIRKVGESRYEIQLAKGDSLLFYNPRLLPDFIISPVENQSGRKNSYGLNKVFLEKREYMIDQLYREN